MRVYTTLLRLVTESLHYLRASHGWLSGLKIDYSGSPHHDQTHGRAPAT